MKSITLLDFLTDEQITQAFAIYLKARQNNRNPAEDICKEITAPNIETINKLLGQENDPKYLAYAIEFTFTSMRGRG